MLTYPEPEGGNILGSFTMWLDLWCRLAGPHAVVKGSALRKHDRGKFQPELLHEMPGFLID